MDRHGRLTRSVVAVVSAGVVAAAAVGVRALVRRRRRAADAVEARVAAARAAHAKLAARTAAALAALRAECDAAASCARRAQAACEAAQAEARAHAAEAEAARAFAAQASADRDDAMHTQGEALARAKDAVSKLEQVTAQMNEAHRALAAAQAAQTEAGSGDVGVAAENLSVRVISRAGSTPTHKQLEHITGALDAIKHPKGSVDDAYIADVVRRPNSQVVVHSRNGTPVGLACFHIELRALHGTFDTILIAVDLLLGSQGASASALLLAFAGWWAAEIKLALRSGINPFPRHASASARAVQIWGKLHAVGSALHLYEEQGWEQQGTSKDGLIRMFKPLTIVNVPEPDDLRASGGAHVNVPCKVVHVWRAPMPLWRRK